MRVFVCVSSELFSLVVATTIFRDLTKTLVRDRERCSSLFKKLDKPMMGQASKQALVKATVVPTRQRRNGNKPPLISCVKRPPMALWLVVTIYIRLPASQWNGSFVACSLTCLLAGWLALLAPYCTVL